MPDSASRGDGEGVAIQLLVYWCILLCQAMYALYAFVYSSRPERDESVRMR